MARLARLFVPGYPLLVMQRGNNRRRIFEDEADYRFYLEILRNASRELGVSLHAYVLMPDHLHLLFSASEQAKASAFMQKLGHQYVRGFNDRHGRSGTLWDGRYRSTAVEPARYFLACCRYLELNPVRAAVVTEAEHYVWSSARHHLGLSADPVISDHPLYWELGNTPFERQACYRELLRLGSPEAELVAIRHAGYGGWMLGDLPASVETGLGRRLTPLPKGRPRKSSD